MVICKNFVSLVNFHPFENRNYPWPWNLVNRFRHQEHEYDHEKFSWCIMKGPQLDFPLTAIWFPDLEFMHSRIFRLQEQKYSDGKFLWSSGRFSNLIPWSFNWMPSILFLGTHSEDSQMIPYSNICRLEKTFMTVCKNEIYKNQYLNE